MWKATIPYMAVVMCGCGHIMHHSSTSHVNDWNAKYYMKPGEGVNKPQYM